MKIDTNTLIAELTGDLRPVRLLSLREGFLAAAGGTVATLTFVALGFGVRSDVLFSILASLKGAGLYLSPPATTSVAAPVVTGTPGTPTMPGDPASPA